MTAKSTRVKADFGALDRVSEIAFDFRARSRYDHVFAYLDVEHALRLVIHDESNVRLEHRPDERQTSAVRLVTRSPFLRSCDVYRVRIFYFCIFVYI